MSVKGEKYGSKKAMMKHEKMEKDTKEAMMEYGKPKSKSKSKSKPKKKGK